MKSTVLVIGVVLALFVQGISFAKGIAEERTGEYNTLAAQADGRIKAGDYDAAISLLKRMHELKPQDLTSIEQLGSLYMHTVSEEQTALTNAMYLFLEAEKQNSINNNVYYNLACLYSLAEDMEKTTRYMNKAIALGYSNFEQMSQDENLVNFRTSSWWKGIADNYGQIEKLLDEYRDFTNIEAEKSDKEKMDFYNNVITNLKELAPHISCLRYKPLSSLIFLHYNQGNYRNTIESLHEIIIIQENIR